MKLKTCVTPAGRFIFGVHKPYFNISNLREHDGVSSLGSDAVGNPVMNHINFPDDSVEEAHADIIYEIPNPFPFRGTTYIASNWANAKSKNPKSINLPMPKEMSFSQSIMKSLGKNVDLDKVFSETPQQILLTIAAESTDSDDLIRIARICCIFDYSEDTETITGVRYETDKHGNHRMVIKNHELFEVVVNNSCLPEQLREVMVLRPGVQGGSEIVGDYSDKAEQVHVYEYLRRNSYIPWGHFAANMSEDAVRYDMADLTEADIKGLRHLYYQRTYSRVGEMLGVGGLNDRKQSSEEDLEILRLQICDKLRSDGADDLFFNATLWGWNYGFSYTPAGYNLHGSHQQIHQQYALIPTMTESFNSFEQTSAENGVMDTYGCGDQVYSFIKAYRELTGNYFFQDYLNAINNNKRMDRHDDEKNSLVVFEDKHVILFVPKAQTSQWELNLMTKEPFANILETNLFVRKSIDKAMLFAMESLSKLGAQMISVIELSGRFGVIDERQHLLYAFLPKIPFSMGAFTEAQQRFINGHFPEDFAYACREVNGQMTCAPCSDFP